MPGRSFALRFLVVVLLLGAAGVGAQQDPRTRVSPDAYRVARDIMSPFCPGMTLAECPSEKAVKVRREIAARLEAGESPDAIVEWLVARYGEEVRGAPAPRGIALALWVVPAAMGLGLIAMLRILAGLHSRSQPSAPPAASPITTDPAWNHRLDEALADLD